ncbi:hypothetical protein EJ05DRAFT_514760 [Pseudovirgaria hyperparasitica]|uniref:Uncharacterized protein n=1 Tax=Pseudovirgaria hyperparasitica TaxID=470096 RepID=A0A6A6VVU4_9PEZI|nr:uncharacterized protein EJ05DRAFT_514760 [Pseudovirgaria hyperparasitica]KAF2753834.1 hypothetical protein EJ05DRAFT_514760 [Pseudovirgaria hyperparasitica]
MANRRSKKGNKPKQNSQTAPTPCPVLLEAPLAPTMPNSARSVQDDIHDAVCLLALVRQRGPDIGVGNQNNDQGQEGVAYSDSASDVTGGSNDDGCDQLYSSSPDHHDGQHLDALRNKLLDRLAEVLARYKKSNHASGSCDSKHVASTMMVLDQDKEGVNIVCSKNEGLDQTDLAFLRDWTKLMMEISQTGKASSSHRTRMSTLVVEHQRPRIETYVNWLRAGSQAHMVNTRTPSSSDVSRHDLTSDRLDAHSRMYSAPDPRLWTDDHGLQYDIRCIYNPSKPGPSLAAASGESLRDIDKTLTEFFADIELMKNATQSARSNKLNAKVSQTALQLWAGARKRASLLARLRKTFSNDKVRSQILKAICSLAKVAHAVDSFLLGAEVLVEFRNTTYVAVDARPVELSDLLTKRAVPSTLQLTERLGIPVRRSDWKSKLEHKEANLARIWKQRLKHRHVHAELQILHFSESKAMKATQRVHKYIGCSKRCCFLCDHLRLAHGQFRVRGTHKTIIHRWHIPYRASDETIHMNQNTLKNFFGLLKFELQTVFDGRVVGPEQSIAQSSLALSTAQLNSEEEERVSMEECHRDIDAILGGCAVFSVDNISYMPIHGKPGFAYVMGGPHRNNKMMAIEEAELLKTNSIRAKLGLEKLGFSESRTPSPLFRTCRLCQKQSSFRCSRCRAPYCSLQCQRRHWRLHVFHCSVKDRPNPFDHLWLLVRLWPSVAQESSSRTKLIEALFADDDLCRTFGFVNCESTEDIVNLLCIYGRLIRATKSQRLQYFLGPGMLEKNISNFVEIESTSSNNTKACRCVQWYIERHREGFNIPDYESKYQGWWHGVEITHFMFQIDDERLSTLSDTESQLTQLYYILFRDHGYRITPHQGSLWMKFGFCFCKSEEQNETLAEAYMQLVVREVSLKDITKAYDNDKLLDLMSVNGFDISKLVQSRVQPRAPSFEESGVYHLMIEVSHALSGGFCRCFQPLCRNHSRYETILSRESEVVYGFLGTSAWERWQLLNFYAYVFKQPDFDARAMQAATRRRDQPAHLDALTSSADPDTVHKARQTGGLSAYLRTIVPDFERKIGNPLFAGALFPKLGSCVSYPEGRGVPDNCMDHELIISEGLSGPLACRSFENSRNEDAESGMDSSD